MNQLGKKYFESIRHNAFEMLDMIEHLTIKGEICKFTTGDLDRLHGARCAIKNVICGWENFTNTRLGKEIKVEHKASSNENITSGVTHSVDYTITIDFDSAPTNGHSIEITFNDDNSTETFTGDGSETSCQLSNKNLSRLSDITVNVNGSDLTTYEIDVSISVTINDINVHCPYTNFQVKFDSTSLVPDNSDSTLYTTSSDITNITDFTLVPKITADINSPKLGFIASLYMVGFRLQAEAIPMFSLSDVLYNPFCNGTYEEFLTEYEDVPDILCEDITEFLEAIDRLEDLIKSLSENNDSKSLDSDVGGVCSVSCPPTNTGLGGSYKNSCKSDDSSKN